MVKLLKDGGKDKIEIDESLYNGQPFVFYAYASTLFDRGDSGLYIKVNLVTCTEQTLLFKQKEEITEKVLVYTGNVNQRKVALTEYFENTPPSNDVC
jgi:hypothetical protein